MTITETLAREFSVAPWQAENLTALLDEGNTLPFIARYRKERHGSLDDQLLREMAERLGALRALDSRRGEILGSLDHLGLLTSQLRQAVESAATQRELEDLYRPYRPKRRTRAGDAKEKGLEPLAELLLAQEKNSPPPLSLAEGFVSGERGVSSPEAALAGARDILAERVSDDPALRKTLRGFLASRGRLRSLAATEEDSVYRLYYDFDQPLSKLPAHRILAINRGEAAGILKVRVACPEGEAEALCRAKYVKPGRPASEQVRAAVDDGFDRLLFPSLERETRQELTARASQAAIALFGENLRQLLLRRPVKGHTVLALDPGIRTGCKLAVVDKSSRVLDSGVLYPLPQQGRVPESREKLLALIRKHGVTAIAIGNGTACRETERFVAESIAGLDPKPGYTIVDEAGASVYSASPLAAEELPELDVSIRGAVSLARRLQDPLAELVKIDPKAIGVGQYQHDMDPRALDERLNGVVEDCVNLVGADLNTASPALLSRVAGIGPKLAKNIVAYRQEHGPFPDRARLKRVDKLGPKAFLQCAGFLRVHGGTTPLDSSAVHPESYAAAQRLLSLLGYGAFKPGASFPDLRERAEAYPLQKLCQELDVGAPTLRDIIEELLRPGRDPREDLPPVALRTDVLRMEDLRPGMELRGTVRNVVDFGAFVDIGVHRDGLLHVSRMAKGRVAHPSQILKVGDVLTVWVADVDRERNTISLSLLGPA